MTKRILSLILVVALFPYIISNAQESEFDASVFGDNAEYLLEEHFAAVFQTTVGGTANSRPSGWDIDYRGGQVLVQSGSLKITDFSQKEKISLSHEILPVKSGAFTFEMAVSFDSDSEMSFSVILGGVGDYAMNLNFYGGEIYSIGQKGAKTTLADFFVGQTIYIKAQVSLNEKKIHLYLNNRLVFLTIPSGCTEVRNVSFYTGETEECYGHLHFVNVYKNYIVREKFMTAATGSVPYDFSISAAGTGSGISHAPGSAYADDQNGFLLKNTAQMPNATLTKFFDNTNTKTSLSWTMLLPQKQDGIYVKLMQGTTEEISIYTHEGDFYAGSTKIKENYRANLWYNFRVDIDTAVNTLDFTVNYKKAGGNLPYSGGTVNSIVFSKTAAAIGETIIDDIEVCKTFEKYADYPAKPVPAISDEVYTGMVVYPMWREGMHFGWDALSPYASERKPLLGYYTEGQRETADWQNKWMTEHGIDYALYPFVRPASDAGEPVKKPTRGEDLHDGYMNSDYSTVLKFAVFLSAFSMNNYHGADEFIENVIPYLSEYYFNDPRYMKVNNKLPIFCYSFVNMANVLGGASEAKKVIIALREEAQRLGFDDIIFGADAASAAGHAMVEQVDEPVYIWSYGSQTDNIDYLREKTDEEYLDSARYIPSIPMGFDTTPWRESTTGMITPQGFRSLCDYIKQKAEFVSSSEKMVLLTCWNEYGEGHYFAPTTKNGFDYLNVIRDEFTAEGIKTNEETPSNAAIARMGVLYPNGRGALKTLPDRKLTEEDLLNREILYRYEFDTENSPLWTKNQCTVVLQNGCLECAATGNDPQIYCNIDTGIDITKIRAVKIRAYTKGVHELRLLYTTVDNPNYGYGKMFYANRISGIDEYSELILYPYAITSDSDYPAPSGTITSIRIDPSDDIYLQGGNFGIDWFEFYGDTTNTKLTINGAATTLTSTPATQNGTIFLPIYSVLLNEMKAYPLWNEPTKTLTVQKNGRTISVTADSSTVKINGTAKTWMHVPFYEKGNLFVPYKEFFAGIGYSAGYDEGTNTINCTEQPAQTFSAAAVISDYGANILRGFQSVNIGDFGFYQIPQAFNVETVDDRSILKIVPNTAGQDGLFSVAYVNYKGERRKLNAVIADGRKIKVSFSYKGVCSQIMVENREGENNTGYKPAITDISPSEWKEFSYVFDNAGITVPDEISRWLSIRVKSTTAQLPYLYISDFKIQCFEELETLSYDTNINFRVTTPTNQEEETPYSCMIAEYGADYTLVRLTEAANGNTSEDRDYVRYYPYMPQSGNTVKAFLWSGMSPLCGTNIITKK